MKLSKNAQLDAVIFERLVSYAFFVICKEKVLKNGREHAAQGRWILWGDAISHLSLKVEECPTVTDEGFDGALVQPQGEEVVDGQ